MPEPHTPWQDTVLVGSGSQVEIAFRADNPGPWMFHCHVLEHQASHGLVRLAGTGCRKRTSPHVVADGQRLRWPLPGTSPRADTILESRRWLRDPGVDTYYAVAVTDAVAARKIANLLDELPARCGGSVQPGLENNALHRWLDEFAMLAARHGGHVDWRAIQVKDVL